MKGKIKSIVHKYVGHCWGIFALTKCKPELKDAKNHPLRKITDTWKKVTCKKCLTLRRRP